MKQMRVENTIERQVKAAKHNPLLADALIKQYKPFIATITSEACKRHVVYGVDDELSFAMLGFYHAINSYESDKGTFLNYAARVMKHKVIDYLRSEKKHTHISLDESDEENQTLLDHIPSNTYRYTIPATTAIQAELIEFQQELQSFSLQLTDIAKQAPKQTRTLEACRQIIYVAMEKPSLIMQLKESKRLPIKDILQLVNIDRKIIERHRSYIIALLIIYSNGYEFMREHLHKITQPKTKGVIS